MRLNISLIKVSVSIIYVCSFSDQSKAKERNLIKKHSGEWFRSTDLWVMSPARYHCATPLVTGHLHWQPPYIL